MKKRKSGEPDASESDELEDYMRDDFLERLVQEADTTHQRRTGETYSQKRQRQLREIEAKNQRNIEEQRKRLPLPLLEKERRSEGLKTAISDDNKGFKMLQKMGYQPGLPLGNPEKSTALIEPIPVKMMAKRTGLGQSNDDEEASDAEDGLMRRLAAKKSEQAREEQYREQLNREQEQKLLDAQKSFHSRTLLKRNEKQVRWDWGKSRAACEQLDRQNNRTDAHGFWPDDEKKGELSNEEVPEKEELSFETICDRLVAVTHYLRETYHYCHWCGALFENAEQLAEECPGETREAHDA